MHVRMRIEGVMECVDAGQDVAAREKLKYIS